MTPNSVEGRGVMYDNLDDGDDDDDDEVDNVGGR